MFTRKKTEKQYVQPNSLELIANFNLNGSGAIDWNEETLTLSLFGNTCFSYEQRSFVAEKFSCICADLKTKCLRLMLNDDENQFYTQYIIAGCIGHGVDRFVFLNNIKLDSSGLKGLFDVLNKFENRMIYFDFRSVTTNILIHSLRDCTNLCMSVTIDNIDLFRDKKHFKPVHVVVQYVNVVELNFTITHTVSDSDLSEILNYVNVDMSNIKRLKITSVSKRESIAPIIAFLNSGRCPYTSFGYLSKHMDSTQTKELLDAVKGVNLEEFLYYDGVNKCIYNK